MSNAASIVPGAVGLALTCLVASPSGSSLALRFKPKKSPDAYRSDKLYEDADGKASEESQSSFSTVVPRSIGLGASLLGFAAAVALAVLVTTGTVQDVSVVADWLQAAAWLVLCVQAVAVFLEPVPKRRYGLGIQAAVSSFLNILCLVLARVDSIEDTPLVGTQVGLLSTQAGLAVTSFLAFVSIQRRPEVFYGDRPVDGELTVSFLARLSYTWCGKLLKQAQKNRKLQYEDLPHLISNTRAAGLSDQFKRASQFNRLWKTVAWNRRWAFGAQTLLVMIQSLLTFGPPLAMFNILKVLESSSGRLPGTVWLWVLLLGSSMIIEAIIDNWLFWVVW